jgi:hypothetical protein
MLQETKTMTTTIMTQTTQGVQRMFPVAIDLGRFSGMQQELGNSRHRQKSLADAWSEKTGIPIDVTLFDEGASGWGKKGARRRVDDRYALAQFLGMIQAGRVQPGDYLLLENLDRLSREQEVPATNLLTSILVAGVIVVQLAPYEMTLTDQSDAFEIMRAVMELSRGHGESQRKHQTVSASYASNRVAAATCGCGHPWHTGRCTAEGCRCKKFVIQEIYQGKLPVWLRREGQGKGANRRRILKIAERVAVVRCIFLRAATGMSCGAIAQQLVAEKVPPFGDRVPRLDPETGEQARTRTGRLRWKKNAQDLGSGTWTRAYIAKILTDRAAMGEFQTRTGEIIPIPAAVTKDEWDEAQSGRADRRQHRGRLPASGATPLFSSLLTDARTGHPYYARTRREGGRTWRVLSPRDPRDEAYGAGSFPEEVFEQAVLSCLAEIDPADVTEREGPDPVAVLSGRLEQVRGRLKELTAQGKELGGKLPRGIVQMMAELEAEDAALEEERRQAEQAARHPLSETLGQAKGLLGVLDTAERRLRFRSLLRQMVEDMRLLVVQRGWDQVAAVQMRFKKDGLVRSYLIVHRKHVMPSGRKAQRRKKEKGTDVWAVRSLAAVARRDDLDLRNASHVQALELELLSLDLGRMTAADLPGSASAG